MKIQLKNIKHSAFASQETHCYQASVYFEGKKAGTTGNDGHGGCDHEHPENQPVWDAMTAYIKTLPSTEENIGKDSTFTMKPDLESICCDLVNDNLMSKNMKRLLKNRVLYIKEEVLYQTEYAKNPLGTLPNWITQITEKNDVEMVLNSLNDKEALAAYRKFSG